MRHKLTCASLFVSAHFRNFHFFLLFTLLTFLINDMHNASSHLLIHGNLPNRWNIDRGHALFDERLALWT